MPSFLKTYGTTEGPLGLPMNDKQAQTLEQLLKALPTEDRQVKRITIPKATAELLDGERADISWISTESVDRQDEIVIARGMNDSHFAANPMVTMNHCYWDAPVGKSLWRKRAKNGSVSGIRAKTYYPTKPDDYPGEDWPPDAAFSLVKAGMLNGKSVGFLKLKSHQPSSHEIAARPELAEVYCIIDEWLLLEYACTFMPMNQDAVVEQVAKSGVTIPKRWLPNIAQPAEPTPAAIPFTSEAQIAEAIRRRLGTINPSDIAQQAWKLAYDRATGKV